MFVQVSSSRPLGSTAMPGVYEPRPRAYAEPAKRALGALGVRLRVGHQPSLAPRLSCGPVRPTGALRLVDDGDNGRDESHERCRGALAAAEPPCGRAGDPVRAPAPRRPRAGSSSRGSCHEDVSSDDFAGFLAWRCGVTRREAREVLRVAEALQELPATRAAFSRGALTFTKVRALDAGRDRCLGGGPARAGGGAHGLAARARAARLSADRRRGRPRDARAGVRGLVTSRRTARSPCAPALRPRTARCWSRRSRPRGSGWSSGVARNSGTPTRTPTSRPTRRTPCPRPSLRPARVEALLELADAALAAPAGVERTGGDRCQVVVHVDAPTLAGGDPVAAAASSTTTAHCRSFPDGPSVVLRRLRSSRCSSATASPRCLGGTQRPGRSRPPCAVRCAGATRGCRFPGCNQRHHVDGHHIKSTGPMAARPRWRMLSPCVAFTTASSTKAATRSRATRRADFDSATRAGWSP